MAISWLDTDGLWPLLDGGTQIVIVNAADPEIAVAIVGAVAALHGASGAPAVRRSTDLSLEPGESFAFADDRPPSAAPRAVETMLRILAPLAGVTAEVYIRSDESRTTPIASIEIGILATVDAPPGAVPVPEVEGISAYIKLEP
jgi:hypothetical protein